jgi:hypothetical protein
VQEVVTEILRHWVALVFAGTRLFRVWHLNRGLNWPNWF